MTNREKILSEINAMNDDQLVDLLLGSKHGNDIALEVCDDCKAEYGTCIYHDAGDPCHLSEAEWMSKTCRRERLLVG